jgi:hypothetical protein
MNHMPKKKDPDKPERGMTPEKEQQELKDRAKRQEDIKKWQEERKKKGH